MPGNPGFFIIVFSLQTLDIGGRRQPGVLSAPSFFGFEGGDDVGDECNVRRRKGEDVGGEGGGDGEELLGDGRCHQGLYIAAGPHSSTGS